MIRTRILRLKWRFRMGQAAPAKLFFREVKSGCPRVSSAHAYGELWGDVRLSNQHL